VETCRKLKGTLLKTIFLSVNEFKDNKGFSPGEERPRSEADHPSPSNAQIKNTFNYASTSPYVIMVCPGIIYSLYKNK
jgi:hypothetical protein